MNYFFGILLIILEWTSQCRPLSQRFLGTSFLCLFCLISFNWPTSDFGSTWACLSSANQRPPIPASDWLQFCHPFQNATYRSQKKLKSVTNVSVSNSLFEQRCELWWKWFHSSLLFPLHFFFLAPKPQCWNDVMNNGNFAVPTRIKVIKKVCTALLSPPFDGNANGKCIQWVILCLSMVFADVLHPLL